MNYHEIFKKAFSAAVPETTCEAAAQEIIRKGNVMEKKKRKMNKGLVIGAAAAALLAAGGITVAAANGWDITAAFSELFSTRSSERGATQTSSLLDYSKAGKVLTDTLHADGLTIEMKGIIAGSNAACVIYDVIPDETVINDSEMWFATAHADIANDTARVRSSDNGTITNSNNAVTFYNLTTFDDVQTLSEETLTLEINSIMCTKDTESRTYEINESISIPIDFDIYDEQRCFTVNTSLTVGNSCIKVQTVNITGFTAELIFDDSTIPYENDDDLTAFYSMLRNITVILDDGTAVGTSGGGNTLLTLLSPINVDSVSQITIGDTTIPLK